MANVLYAVMKDGEFAIGGSSHAKRHSKKPHVYTNERNAKLGKTHVEFKEGQELEIVPFVPLSDLLALAKMCEDMFPYAGTETDIELFEKIIGKYGYGLSEDGTVCPKDEL